MKLTKKEALEKTIEMWTWLAEHPEAEKKDYFKENNISNRPICDCYCCQYALEINAKSRCRYCPAWFDTNGCYVDNSPYFKWRYEKDSKSKRTKYALEIVALAKEKIKELEGD